MPAVPMSAVPPHAGPLNRWTAIADLLVARCPMAAEQAPNHAAFEVYPPRVWREDAHHAEHRALWRAPLVEAIVQRNRYRVGQMRADRDAAEQAMRAARRAEVQR